MKSFYCNCERSEAIYNFNVIPAKAGIQYFRFLDSRFRGNDKNYIQRYSFLLCELSKDENI